MKEKKGWSVERIAKTAVLTAGILIVIAIVASMIFKNPIGANVRLITRLIFAGTVVTAVFILAMWIYRARKKNVENLFGIVVCIISSCDSYQFGSYEFLCDDQPVFT